MSKRSYRQHCGLARALDVVGSRWTLLIVRNLLLGPQRYTDLLRGLPGITTNLLAARLDEMGEEGLVERVTTPAPTPVEAYRLTERGRGLEEAVQALGRWGWPLMADADPDDARNGDWIMVAMRRRYRGGPSTSVVLVIDESAYVIRFDGDTLRIRRGTTDHCDVTVSIAMAVLSEVFYGGTPVSELIEAGRVETAGSRRAFRRFVRAFGGTWGTRRRD